MVSDARAETSPSATGNLVGRWIAGRLRRAWATESGRRRLGFLVGSVVVAAMIGLGAMMFSSMSGRSQSYRDGYSEGTYAYGVYSAEGALQACRTTELRRGSAFGGLPSGDNSTEWLQGCIAAFNAAQSDN